MKEYTIDFGAEYIEAKNDNEASKLALEYVDNEHGLWKDDIADVENMEDGTYMIDFAPYIVTAKNSDIAMKKAEKYAKNHDLEIVDIDEGYDT